MADQIIPNPSGAFQPLSDPSAPPGRPDYAIAVVYNSGAAKINVGEWVQLDITSGAAHENGVIRGVHGGNVACALGIALDTIAVGGYGRVCKEGPCQALVGAAGVTAGQLAIASATAGDDGQIVSAAAPGTAGSNIGVVTQTQATHGGLAWIWVLRT